jgi:hypothetical protein
MPQPEIAFKARTCTDLIGGSQDNGTWSYNLNPTEVDSTWFESVSGDGVQSLIDTGNPNIRMHTYYGPNRDVNFKDSEVPTLQLMAASGLYGHTREC